MANTAEKGAVRSQEKLLVKKGIKTATLDGNIVTLSVDISGIIDAKNGKDTHVTVSDRLNLARSDGRVYTLQVNGWYK
jgi:hypothetical protein